MYPIYLQSGGDATIIAKYVTTAANNNDNNATTTTIAMPQQLQQQHEQLLMETKILQMEQNLNVLPADMAAPSCSFKAAV